MSIKSFFSSILLVLSTVLFLESLKIIALPFKFTYQSFWGPYTSSISSTVRSTSTVLLYDLVNNPLLLLLSVGLIAFAIYRLSKSELNTIIEIFILVSCAIILLAMRFRIINLRLLGQSFWPIIILFSVLMLISSRNNHY
jgi:hypothetical protein